MRTKLNAEAGFYEPTFLRMHVDTTSDLSNPHILNDATAAAYLHEYVHFLQDLTTTYGLINISTVVDYLKQSVSNVLTDLVIPFNVPIHPRSFGSGSVRDNLALREIYSGSVLQYSAEKIITVQPIERFVFLVTGRCGVKGIQIELEASDGSRKHDWFGAICILESMAYIIEDTIYPAVLSRPPSWPYMSAEFIASEIYSSFATNRLNVLALCDISLQLFNPGEFFYETLIKMKKENYVPSSPYEIYDWAFQRTNLNFEGTKNLSELMLLVSNQACEQLTGYLTTSVFDGTKTWIERTLDAAAGIRTSRRWFFLDLVANGKISSNRSFKELVFTVGTPVVTNALYEGTFKGPSIAGTDIHPDYLWAISQIYLLLRHGQRECQMQTYCKEAFAKLGTKTLVDKRCGEAPWSRVNDDELCPYATMWKTWGLSGYSALKT